MPTNFLNPATAKQNNLNTAGGFERVLVNDKRIHRSQDSLSESWRKDSDRGSDGKSVSAKFSPFFNRAGRYFFWPRRRRCQGASDSVSRRLTVSVWKNFCKKNFEKNLLDTVTRSRQHDAYIYYYRCVCARGHIHTPARARARAPTHTHTHSLQPDSPDQTN